MDSDKDAEGNSVADCWFVAYFWKEASEFDRLRDDANPNGVPLTVDYNEARNIAGRNQKRNKALSYRVYRGRDHAKSHGWTVD